MGGYLVWIVKTTSLHLIFLAPISTNQIEIQFNLAIGSKDWIEIIFLNNQN
jgi:hypothetical protein